MNIKEPPNLNSLEDLIHRFKHGPVSDRHKCLARMMNYAFEDIKDTLFEALKDNNHRIRGTAAKLIGKLGDATVVPPILHLLYDDSWIIRSSAQEALGLLSPSIALPAFRGIIATSKEDPNLIRNLATVIAKYNQKEAVELLLSLFNDSNDDELRASIVDSLSKKSDTQSVEIIFKALNDKNWNVRSAAAKSLSQLDFRIIKDRAVEALADPNRLVHMAVVEIFIRLASDDVIDAVAELLESSNTLVRLNAINVLSGINNEESMTLIVSALSDKSTTVRNRAAEALAGSKSEGVFQLLTRCLKSSNWNLKQGAIKTLALIGNEEAVDLLEQLLKEDNLAVKVSVMEVLADIGSRRCIRIIMDHLSFSELGKDAIRIIKGLDPDKAITQLISLLTEDDIYEPTLNALAELNRVKVLRYLASRVASGSPKQQIRSVEAIGQLGGSQALDYLTKLSETKFHDELNKAITSAIVSLKKKLA